MDDVAQKIGAGRRAIADAEKGKASTTIATYAGLLWTYGLLGQIDAVAAPGNDEEGSALARLKERSRARPGRKGLRDDF